MKILSILVSVNTETPVVDETGEVIGFMKETVNAKTIDEAERLLDFVRRQQTKERSEKDAVQPGTFEEPETVH